MPLSDSLRRIDMLAPHFLRASLELQTLVARGRQNDYRGVLQQCRVALEMLLRDLVERMPGNNPRGPRGGELEAMIHSLKDIPDRVHLHMKTVQQWGNRGAHDGGGKLDGEPASVTCPDSIAGASALVEILNWFAEKHLPPLDEAAMAATSAAWTTTEPAAACRHLPVFRVRFRACDDDAHSVVVASAATLSPRLHRLAQWDHVDTVVSLENGKQIFKILTDAHRALSRATKSNTLASDFVVQIEVPQEHVHHPFEDAGDGDFCVHDKFKAVVVVSQVESVRRAGSCDQALDNPVINKGGNSTFIEQVGLDAKTVLHRVEGRLCLIASSHDPAHISSIAKAFQEFCVAIVARNVALTSDAVADLFGRQSTRRLEDLFATIKQQRIEKMQSWVVFWDDDGYRLPSFREVEKEVG